MDGRRELVYGSSFLCHQCRRPCRAVAARSGLCYACAQAVKQAIYPVRATYQNPAWKIAVFLVLCMAAWASADSLSGPGAAAPPVTGEASTGGEGSAALPARSFSWASYSYTQTQIQSNVEDQRLIIGARIGARVPLPGGAWLAARADASALGDGQAIGERPPVDIFRPETYQTLEGHVALWAPVSGPVSAVGLFGAAVALLNGRPDPADRYPLMYGGGARVDVGSAWAIAAVGVHQASGDGLRLLVAAHVPLGGGATAAIADGALGGEGSFVRAGVAVRIGGN